MPAQFIRVEDHDGVAHVLIDRPKVNALSLELLGEIEDCFAGFASSPPRAVVVSGGPRIFSAGADINQLADHSLSQQIADGFSRALDQIARLPRVVIAAISGVAVGGGCELALACDFRYAASNARLGQPEILLGLIPGAGGTQRLARLVGPAVAKDLVFSGRQVSADEALAIGLVDRVFEESELLEQAIAAAQRFGAGALFAQGLAKRAIEEGLDGELARGLALERQLFVASFASKDAEVGIQSFLESGPGHAKFVGE